MLLFILKAIIMGVVEGITEFLPISSTGHMIIVGHFIGFETPYVSDSYVKMFEVVIQLGAILSVVVYYWDKIKKSFCNFFGKNKSGLKFWLNIIIAFIPSAVVGLALNDFIHKNLFSTITVISALIIGGILMIVIENKYRRKYKINDLDKISFFQSFKIGCFQCLALWPGMSRSASTIMGAWISGLSTVAAAEFSFFLAIPTMFAASGWSLLKLVVKEKVVMSAIEIVALGAGFIVAFIVALLVIDKFMNFLKKKPMRIFAIYRIFIGIVLLGLSLMNIISI